MEAVLKGTRGGTCGRVLNLQGLIPRSDGVTVNEVMYDGRTQFNEKQFYAFKIKWTCDSCEETGIFLVPDGTCTSPGQVKGALLRKLQAPLARNKAKQHFRKLCNSGDRHGVALQFTQLNEQVAEQTGRLDRLEDTVEARVNSTAGFAQRISVLEQGQAAATVRVDKVVANQESSNESQAAATVSAVAEFHEQRMNTFTTSGRVLCSLDGCDRLAKLACKDCNAVLCGNCISSCRNCCPTCRSMNTFARITEVRGVGLEIAAEKRVRESAESKYKQVLIQLRPVPVPVEVPDERRPVPVPVGVALPEEEVDGRGEVQEVEVPVEVEDIPSPVYSPPSTQSSSPPLTRSSPNEERNCNVEETRAWEERRAMNKRTLLADEKFLQTFVVESESRARRSRRRGN